MSHSLRHLETQETEYQVTYQALIRNLKRRKGFGLLFVRCTPAQGEEIIPQMQQDVRNKTIEVLRLEEAKENLFDIISEIQSRQKLDVLIITGIEKSFVEYIKPGIGGQGNYYKEDTVPRILGHLNLERERFRDELKVCLVFFVPRFALKYFVRRAPDFFDWRSGVFEFLTQKDCLERENSQFLAEGYTEHIKLTAQERIAKIFAIQELIEEEGQTPEQKADLCLEQGKVYAAAGEYEEAIVFYERATAINPDSYQAWSFQGLALEILGRLEEAIAAYQRAIEIKPDKDEAWTNLGAALANLGRFEEALTCSERAIQIQPDNHYAWDSRGYILFKLGRLEEAIASWERAIQIQPDYYNTWYNLGAALANLGRYEEAIAAYQRAMEIKPDFHEAWTNLGAALANLGRFEEALTCSERAIQIKPDNHYAWDSRGCILFKLGRLEEAIASWERAIQIQPDYYNTWYNKAGYYASQTKVDLAIENLKQAINLNPDECRERAKTDPDFDKIREDDRFQELLQE